MKYAPVAIEARVSVGLLSRGPVSFQRQTALPELHWLLTKKVAPSPVIECAIAGWSEKASEVSGHCRFQKSQPVAEPPE